jgi:hypothetical protein
MNKWYETDEGKAFIKIAFENAGMPEVDIKDLEPGTYTNDQLAAFFSTQDEFWHALNQLRFNNDPWSKRSVLSFVVEMIPKSE